MSGRWNVRVPPSACRPRLSVIQPTRLYAVYDPHRHQCRIANAGHLPPALAPAGGLPRLLDLPTGAPLGVGGVAFDTTVFDLHLGDRLVLYTDGLVETRRDPIDARLDGLLHALGRPRLPLAQKCQWLLNALRHPEAHDDVALLVAEAQPLAPPSAPSGAAMDRGDRPGHTAVGAV